MAAYKKAPAQVLSYEFRDIFQCIYFVELLQTAGSELMTL